MSTTNFKNYNPTHRYEHPDTTGQPGALPAGSHIQWPDGERATVVQSYLGTRHLVRRSAHGGGEQEDTFDLAKQYGLLTDAIDIVPRGREGGRNPIGDQPMARRNISISHSDWEYAASIGNGASDGIRVALESHRSKAPKSP